MSLKDDISLLSQLPLFAALGEEPLKLLAFGAEKKRIMAGEKLFHQGEVADCAFAVISGELELTSTSGNQVVATKGSLISELALISPTKRKFTATARENSEVMRITSSVFQRLLEEFPESADAVSGRIKANIERIVADFSEQKARFAG